MSELTREELLGFMERRLGHLREDSAQTLRSVGERSSADHLTSAANSLSRNTGAEHELMILLRIAHGMNPNGRWPHPEGTCTQCGRPVTDGETLCVHCQRKAEK